MSQTVVSVSIPDELLRHAAQHAERYGISLEDWVADAMAERARADDAAVNFFRLRAGTGTKADLAAILDKGGNHPPDPGDELEPA